MLSGFWPIELSGALLTGDLAGKNTLDFSKCGRL